MDTGQQVQETKPKLNIKHDWYQTEAAVIVTVLAKNTKKDDVAVHFSETNFSLILKLPTEEEKFTLGVNLAHRVVPDQCSFKLMSSKIEIKLKKLDGIQWTKLEGNAEEKCPKSIVQENRAMGGPPRYPSSNPQHRDWNAIEKDIVKELSQEKLAGEDGVNKLFQKIYGEGSDEVKRAMNKSYVESGGTVLSTNWKDISKEKVPVKPPDGMEWKQWN